MSDPYDFTPPPLPGEASGSAHQTAGAPAQPAGLGGAQLQPPGTSSERGRVEARRGSNGRWVFAVMVAAIALIVVGIGWASVLTFRSSAVTPAATDATGSLHTGQVVSGMCIKDAPDLSGGSDPVTVVRCDDPHHAEALVSYAFTSNQWPGTKEARAEVIAFCSQQVGSSSAAVPVSPSAPDYDWHVWSPTAATWELGDRTGLCVVTTAGPTIGSFGAGTAQDAANAAVVG